MEIDIDALQLLPSGEGQTEMMCTWSCGETCGLMSTCTLTDWTLTS